MTKLLVSVFVVHHNTILQYSMYNFSKISLQVETQTRHPLRRLPSEKWHAHKSGPSGLPQRYSTLNSTIFATRRKRHRQLLHECFASKTSSWSLYCYRNFLSTNINGNKREFSHKTDRALKCVMSGANGVERLNLAKNRRLSTDAESAIHILTFHRWWWWW